MDLEDVVSTSRVSIVEDIPKVHKQRKHIRPQSSPHVSTASSKPSTSGLQNNSDTGQNMKSNEDDESKGSQQDDSGGCVNDWVSGGPVGSKGAVLVFRSCVLASKRSVASSPTRSIGQNTGTTILLNKAKNMARRLVAEPHSFNVRPKNIMHDVMHTFGNSKKYTGQAYVVRHVSDTEVPKTESLEEQGHEAKDPSTQERKRGIEDVLSDLSKITLKKNLNVENTTANIKPAQENQTKDIKDDKKIKKPKIKKRKTSGQFRGPGRVLCNVESDDSEQSLLKEVDNVKVLESSNMPANILKVTYKLVNTETKLLHRLLQAHGLTEVPQSSNDFNLLWSGLHLKPDVLRSLSPYQRVNHFPRSYELTRKDKLFKNIEKMQYFRGVKHFNFVPTTFLMPAEYKELLSAHQRTKGPWIVKPAASSRGRGIYIVNTPEQIPKGENVVVAKYIDKPLLINGHKCDLRLYVCVTSIDPLLIYLYEEGLVRFATVKYDKTNKNLWNPCMHLCNYSINKYHTDYIKCDDPRAGNVGHKWTLSALLKHLRGAGRDTSSLMASIEDLVVKALLSSAQTIAAAARVFVPCSSNCFELFGFDILVDETLKPWLLEINLSPSLGCDSPLDARVKSSLLADTLTLVGIPAVGMAKPENSEKTTSLKMRIGACRRVHSAENVFRGKKANDSLGGMLTGEELRLIRSVKAQYARRGGFVRIFPSQNSWQKYSRYLDPVTGIPVCSTSVNNTVPYAAIQHNYNLLVHSHALPHSQNKSSSPEPSSRVSRYESAAVTSSAPPVQIESRPASAAPRPKHKQLIRNRLLEGMTLTAGESRRLFGLYLTHVLKRVSCGASEQAVQHAALLARFLRRAATTLRMPYHVQGPTSKMCDKDRCAVVAKQLNDFLYMYYRETDLCTDSEDAENCVSNIEFAQFLYGASEADLEEILLLVLKQAGWCCVFVGGGRLCVDGAPPGAAAPAGAPPGRHTLLQLLARLCPTNNRRYRAPSNTSQSLDSRRDDDVTSSLRDISDENAIQTLHDKYKSS